MAASSQAEAAASALAALRLPLAWRLAGRELRGGISGFRLFLFCLALGVALIAGVGSVAEAVRTGLGRDARTLLGGDVELRLLYRPVSAAALATLRSAGRVSEVETLRAMARGGGSDRLLVELKGVDSAYPLSGQVTALPDAPLASMLAERNGIWGALGDPEVLQRLGLKLGGRLTLGSLTYELRGLIRREPDRGADAFLLGPRLMVARESLGATGLIQPGSLIYHLYRIAYRPGLDAKAFLADLERRFPDAGWRIRGLDDASPGVKRFIDRTAMFLTLVGLSTLLVGGVGVGNAVRSYLEGKTETIATLKCLGAPAASIFAIYLSLVLLLALAGVAIGLFIGALAPIFAAGQLATHFGLDLAAGVYAKPLLLGAGFGLLTALGFSLPALMRARDLPPGQLFRDMLGNRRTDWRRSLRRGRLWTDLALILGIGAALVALALVSAGDRGLAGWFVLAALCTLLVFRFLAAGIRRAARRLAGNRRALLRRALADLAGPGAPTGSVVLALGIGLTVLVAVAMVEGNLRHELEQAMPARAPSFYFIDIQPNEVAAFDTLVRGQRGVSDFERVPMLRGRITRMKDIPVGQLPPPPREGWVLRGDRGITWAATLPRGSRLVAGSWWRADYRGPPLVSLDAEVAAAFGLKIGDHISVNVLGREITGTIASLRSFDWATLTINFVMVFSPGILEAAPQTHIATVRIDPDQEFELQRKITDRFSNVSAIRVKDALASAERILTTMTTAVASIALVALAAGIAVLAGAVIADRRRRIYEAVVLKVLGATRRDILLGLALEYGIMGLATAAFALVLGSIAAGAFVTWGLEGSFILLPGVAIATAAAGSVIAIAVGLAGTWRALGQKPAPLLRNE